MAALVERDEVIALIQAQTNFRTGLGFDVHRFSRGRPLILGGVEIPYEFGLLGHSDADVITHAVMDAVLGALGESDIGTFFPDTDPAYQGVYSLELAGKVWSMMEAKGFVLVNLDVMVLAEKPKLAPYVGSIKSNLASVFRTEISNIALKATTLERMGFVGREEGIACFASVLLRKVLKSL